jgi:hypothetical protein
MQFARHIQTKNKATHKSTIGAYIENKYHFGVHKTSIPKTKRLKHQQMDERREK